ncbi:hypothetical protein VUJ46_01310 [Chryseobacterium sp. MYb264]|uniref:hypothetical protein n=1 Tax=Chryseobacterium sp. MYb264 TaxID=2745153 RepID=UPI002E13D9EB|nr:hypothetical protein VUJ46_01310 [Chryseobacterium sp. MYb264]
MVLKVKEESKELYRSEYRKSTVYKNNTLSSLSSLNSFSQSIRKKDVLEFEFVNKDVSDDKANILIFSPVQFQLDQHKNIFRIINKKQLKVQWNKYKEKNRSSKNNTFLFLYERLYFKIDLGMEYDLISNSSHISFFVDVYHKDMEVGSSLDGMSWVHTPLALPLKIEYIIREITDQELVLDGTVSLDEDKLSQLITDKQFQQRAKPYHFTKDFTIISEIRSVFDMNTGYLKHGNFLLKIYSKQEEIAEEVDSKVTFL